MSQGSHSLDVVRGRAVAKLCLVSVQVSFFPKSWELNQVGLLLSSLLLASLWDAVGSRGWLFPSPPPGWCPAGLQAQLGQPGALKGRQRSPMP